MGPDLGGREGGWVFLVEIFPIESGCTKVREYLWTGWRVEAPHGTKRDGERYSEGMGTFPIAILVDQV